MSELFVYWGPDRVGRLAEDRRGGLSFQYEHLNRPMISVAMPLRRRPYGDPVARPFFRGLLPEGEARLMIAYDLELGNEGGSDVAMLGALGKDCAGALVITADDAPPNVTTGADAVRLSETDVAAKLRALPTAPLGVTGEVRVSLPGVQPKLPLTRLSDGSWTLSSPGRPSTHILKPPSAELPDSVPNEVFCMKLAERLGIRAASTDLMTFDGIATLVSTRYDRSTSPDGSVGRIHQEDGCQALSIAVGSPRAKYQHPGGAGPSLAGVAKLLEQWASQATRYELLDDTFVTVAVGNADLHGKNVSLLHDAGRVELAPMYDIMSTVDLVVRDGRTVSPTLGMYIGGKTDVHEVGVEDLLSEAASWGLRASTAERRVRELIDRLPDAIDAAADAVPTVPEERVETIRSRCRALQSQALRLPGHGIDISIAEPSEGSAEQDSANVRAYTRRDGTPVRAHLRRRS